MCSLCEDLVRILWCQTCFAGIEVVPLYFLGKQTAIQCLYILTDQLQPAMLNLYFEDGGYFMNDNAYVITVAFDMGSINSIWLLAAFLATVKCGS